jgi:lipopolysaccharide exporter
VSLVQKAVRGAAWTTITSMLARIASLMATMFVTHLVSPDEYGRASAAVVVVMTAFAVSTFFLPNYLIIDKTAGRSAAWHANIIQLGAGALALSATIPLAPLISRWIDAPQLSSYLPMTVAAFFVMQLSIVPEKLLLRDLRFRHVAIIRMLSELGYAVVVVGGGWLKWGGMALIGGVMARAAIKALGFCLAVPWREWFEPHAFDRPLVGKMFDYGLPLWLNGIVAYIGANWDNLLVSRYFGLSVMAAYSLAFNLADVPATQVGEQLCEVLLPSFALMGIEERRRALVKATLVVALVTFPIAVGLGAVAQSVTEAFFNAKWAMVAPLLSVLCLRSVGRTCYYPLTQYMQSISRNRDLMLLGFMHTAVLLTTLIALDGHSPVASCFGVAGSFMVLLVAAFWAVRGYGIDIAPMVWGLARISLACAAMTAAVLGARGLMRGHVGHATARLLVEVVVGAAVYVPVALVICGPPVRDLLSWARRGLGRGTTQASSTTA